MHALSFTLATFALARAAMPAVPGARDDIDRISTEIVASVSEGLDRIRISTRSTYVPSEAAENLTIILGAEQYRAPPEGMRASHERELFPNGFAFGGFENVRIEIEGRPCHPARIRLSDGSEARSCPFLVERNRPIAIATEAELFVPDRYGAFGRVGRQLTLAAGWYPYVGRIDAAPPRGEHRVELEVPRGHGVVIGRAYFPATGGSSGRVRLLRHVERDVAQVPLALLAPSAAAVRAFGGRAMILLRSGATARDPEARTFEAEEIIQAVEDGLRFWEAEGLSLPTQRDPILVAEAPLRHDLVMATAGPILLSDRAFRMFPASRFLRFHRFPLLRELFTGMLLRELVSRSGSDAKTTALLRVRAEALGAWLLDLYIRSRFGAAEDAFDVLRLWSFIPSIDSMLYAPDLPFVGSYFRLIKEDDPLRPNLVDPPFDLPRGKVIYEKLLDRVGRGATDGAFRRLLEGESMEHAFYSSLGSTTPEFLATWLGPYPSLRYRLASFAFHPVARARCGDRSPACFEATVTIERDGDPAAEPIQVLLEGADGESRIVATEATPAPLRTVTATLSAALDLVVLDPWGRLSETPSETILSPKLDNRSSPAWKFLLNNFNVQLLATEAAIETALDVGFARVHDIRWRYAVRADYAPEAIGLSARASYGLGKPVTAADLAQAIGISIAGEYLRPEFGMSRQSAFAIATSLFYAYDDRQTLWMPEGGRGLRVSLEYNHVFGRLVEDSKELTEDALRATVRAFYAWRLGGAHQLSVRGSIGAYLFGTPREQLLYAIGGRFNARGYRTDARLGKARALMSAEWLHPLIPNLDENGFFIAWLTGIDGTIYADAAISADDPSSIEAAPLLADVGYGFRLYLDYFGVRPGVMAIDVAFPLFDASGRRDFGSPAVYLDFGHSF